MVGGIEAAERLYKKQWRKHFSTAEERQLSRNRLVLQGIGAYMEREGVDSVKACDELDEVFAEVEFKLAPMVAKLREMGLATAAKPRKKRSL
jgi:hypothetical protein